MSGRQRPALGVGLMVASAVCFATMDTTTRYVGALVPAQLLLWVRYSLHAVVMGTWLSVDRGKSFHTSRLAFQVLRGVLLLGSSTLAFFGLRHLPVAEFTAIVMLNPLLVTLLAALVLKEQVSLPRWLLVAGGFAGALIMMRPGSELFGWAALLPLGVAFTNAAFQVLTSHVGNGESAHTTNFYTGLTGMLVLTPILLASPLDADGMLLAAPPLHLALLVMIAVLGTAGHLLLIMSLGMAQTSTLMPFLYTQIGFAAVVGWLVFRAVPDTWGWVGMGIIAACGAAGAWLNVRDARRPVSAVQADTVAE